MFMTEIPWEKSFKSNALDHLGVPGAQAMRLQQLLQEQTGLESEHRDPGELRRSWTTLSCEAPG